MQKWIDICEAEYKRHRRSKFRFALIGMAEDIRRKQNV